MTIKGAKQGLLVGDVLLKGKAVVLVLLLETRLPPSTRHACHGACDSCGTLHNHTLSLEVATVGRPCSHESSKHESRVTENLYFFGNLQLAMMLSERSVTGKID